MRRQPGGFGTARGTASLLAPPPQTLTPLLAPPLSLALAPPLALAPLVAWLQLFYKMGDFFPMVATRS